MIINKHGSVWNSFLVFLLIMKNVRNTIVETVVIQKVAALDLKHVGLDFISKTKDDFYNQH